MGQLHMDELQGWVPVMPASGVLGTDTISHGTLTLLLPMPLLLSPCAGTLRLPSTRP